MSDDHQPWRGGQWQQFWPKQPDDSANGDQDQQQQEQEQERRDASDPDVDPDR